MNGDPRDDRPPAPPGGGGTWLPEWDPEDEGMWRSGGQRLARRTLTITTANLTMAFVVWFVVSALVVRLDDIGFTLSSTQLFWLAALPGLAGGSLRIVHMFLVPLYGTRHVVAISTALLLLPLAGWFFAIQNPGTPYWVLVILAFLAGLGGGNFSSFMPSTSLFYPKRKLGTALAVQAGVGNFGVSLVQFVTPWVIGFGLVGSSQLADGGDEIWLQNAVLVWIPIVAALALVAWLGLRSVPVRANFREQLDIFGSGDTWRMTSLYVMTFGSFAGFAAIFPLLISDLYGDFDDAPTPLSYAFLGPLVGSVARVAAGPFADRFGGARITTLSGVGMLICTIGAAFFLTPASVDEFTWFLAFMLGVFFFSGIGNASTFKQIPMLFPQRQAAGVIGWTAAVGAYGPFLFGILVALVSSVAGSPTYFFLGAAVFYAVNIGINWWYFARRGAPRPC